MRPVDVDRRELRPRGVDQVDELTLVVRLEGLQRVTGASAAARAVATYCSSVAVPVHLRLALAEQVQVRSVEEHDRRHVTHARTTTRRDCVVTNGAHARFVHTRQLAATAHGVMR
jgi:hypothetical protein